MGCSDVKAIAALLIRVGTVRMTSKLRDQKEIDKYYSSESTPLIKLF